MSAPIAGAGWGGTASESDLDDGAAGRPDTRHGIDFSPVDREGV